MVTYNGFAPGEARSVKIEPSKIGNGHSMVEVITRRAGHDFRFHYTVVCECGRKYKSVQDAGRAMRSYNAHHDKAGA